MNNTQAQIVELDRKPRKVDAHRKVLNALRWFYRAELRRLLDEAAPRVRQGSEGNGRGLKRNHARRVAKSSPHVNTKGGRR